MNKRRANRYNIGYGRIGATDEDIEAAAKAADIHDRILTFPKGTLCSLLPLPDPPSTWAT